jgi:hypothetical protein
MNFLTNWTIDIEKIPKYTNFKGVFHQKLHKQLAKLILKNDNPIFTKEMKEEFHKVFENIKNGDLKVKHYQAHDLGRFYSKNNISIIPISKHIKHTMLSYSNYKDLDQVKGHPTIAVSIVD